MKLSEKNKIRSFLLSGSIDSVVSAIITIIIGMLFGLVVLCFMAPNLTSAFNAFRTILTGGFMTVGVTRGLGRVIYYGTPYILSGLSVGISFKTGAFNIGSCGQFTVGGVTAIAVAILAEPVFGNFTWVVALLAGGVAGALWAMVPALLYAFRSVNIILSGIMCNYIGTLMVNWIVRGSSIYDNTQNWTQLIPDNTIIPSGGLDKIFVGTSANVGFFIVIAIAIAVYFVFKKTKLGYDMKVCGLNQDAAFYAGISQKRTVVISIMLSGFMAGMAGAMFFTSARGVRYTLSDNVLENGWTGFSVALLGMSNPIAMIFTGLFVAFLDVGGLNMQAYGLEPEIVTVITASIVFCCAFTTKIKEFYHRLVLGKEGGLK